MGRTRPGVAIRAVTQMQPTTKDTMHPTEEPLPRGGLIFGSASTDLSTAGFGVFGLVGPRTGSSSGVLPGKLSGGGGAPGSRIGEGTSGRGLPGWSSFGGSVGLPGVRCGISGGSVGAANKCAECLIPRLAELFWDVGSIWSQRLGW